MDQNKTGAYLKYLRKENGLTQEQLAEKFYVSSRTVSRWETGTNLPDVESREMLLKVAEYAAEGEKQNNSMTVYAALGVSISLLLCTVLFSTEATGLLYGIVPGDVCYYIIAVVYGMEFFLLISYLRVLPFREKPSWDPRISVQATVVSKEVRSGTHSSGRSQMGYSFVVCFETEDRQILELYAYEIEFGGLKEGTKGVLTYQGRYFVDFK